MFYWSWSWSIQTRAPQYQISVKSRKIWIWPDQIFALFGFDKIWPIFGIQILALIPVRYHQTIRLVYADNFATLSSVVPLYNEILDHSEEWMDSRTTPGEAPLHCSTVAVFAKITDYYNVTSDFFTVSTVLDPRFGLDYYKCGKWDSIEQSQNIFRVVENVCSF